MADFEPAFKAMLVREGGLKLHKVAGDRGGQTYGGIARRWHPDWPGWSYIDRGETPPTELVRQFYEDKFWKPMWCDRMTSQEIAETIFSFGVNADDNVAIRLAQIVVGTVQDGVIGPKTLAALNAADPKLFVPWYSLAKLARYRDIVTKDRTQMKFFLGWINRLLSEAQ